MSWRLSAFSKLASSRSAGYFGECTPTTMMLDVKVCSRRLSVGRTCRQFTQQGVQKSRMTRRPRKSLSDSGWVTLNHCTPVLHSSGAGAKPNMPFSAPLSPPSHSFDPLHLGTRMRLSTDFAWAPGGVDL